MKTQSKQQENKHETKTDTMTMKDLEKLVDYYSEKASTYCHQLGMAGVAVIWILYSNAKELGILKSQIPMLSLALLFFIITITLSLLHYALLAVVSNSQYKKKRKESGVVENLENQDIRTIPLIKISSFTFFKELGKQLGNDKNRDNQEIKAIPFIEISSWIFFIAKNLALITGYVIVIVFFSSILLK